MLMDVEYKMVTNMAKKKDQNQKIPAFSSIMDECSNVPPSFVNMVDKE